MQLFRLEVLHFLKYGNNFQYNNFDENIKRIDNIFCRSKKKKNEEK